MINWIKILQTVLFACFLTTMKYFIGFENTVIVSFSMVAISIFELKK